MAKTNKKTKKAPAPPPRPVCSVCGSYLPEIARPTPDPDGGPWLQLVWSDGKCVGRCSEWAEAREYHLSPGGAYLLDGLNTPEVVEVNEETAREAVFVKQFRKLGDPGEEQICAVFEIPYLNLEFAQPVEVPNA